MNADLILTDLLKLLNDEDLIRFVRRAEIRGMFTVAEMLSAEQNTREDQRQLLRYEPQE